jgi:hypothetical protein
METAERWVGSCQREILDHVIPLNEPHLRRLIRDYVNYHHEDRIHDSFNKNTPTCRPVEPKASAKATVIAMPTWADCFTGTVGKRPHKSAAGILINQAKPADARFSEREKEIPLSAPRDYRQRGSFLAARSGFPKEAAWISQNSWAAEFASDGSDVFCI